MPAVIYEFKLVQQFLNYLLLLAVLIGHIKFLFEAHEDEPSLGHIQSSCGKSKILRLDQELFISNGNSGLFIWRIATGIGRLWFTCISTLILGTSLGLNFSRLNLAFLHREFRRRFNFKRYFRISNPINMPTYVRFVPLFTPG